MEKYRSASSKIHRIFERYTSLIEPLSLDEAYLDVTECSLFGGDASAIAQAIRDAVRQKSALPFRRESPKQISGQDCQRLEQT